MTGQRREAHLEFTPLPGEPVGCLIEPAGEELFMFSTDLLGGVPAPATV